MHWKLGIPVGLVFVTLTAALAAVQQRPNTSKQSEPSTQVAQLNAAPQILPRITNADALAAQPEQIERGKYLANNVALCVICHSPKDADGNPIATQLFKGDVIPLRPANTSLKTWADHAPALGPLAGGASDEVVQLLQTGIWPRTGQSPRRPMPPFRMKKEDAQAVVAYLKSLPG